MPKGNFVGAPAKPAGGKLYVVVRTFGELLVTAGVVILLFVVYTLYVTDLVAGQKQKAANSELEMVWAKPAPPRVEPVIGQTFSRLYIPRFGEDFRFAVQEGVGKDQLDVGPGHYPGTALPGEPGNFGVAGHRIGKGAPFNRLDELESCDPVVVETARDFFIYRVIPMPDEVDGWERSKQARPDCANVPSLRKTDEPGGGPYRETVGRRIVTPDRGDAVSPVPYQPNSALQKAHQAALLTLTTCHPEFGNSERMIIHAVLTQQVAKKGTGGYPELLAQIGER